MVPTVSPPIEAQQLSQAAKLAVLDQCEKLIDRFSRRLHKRIRGDSGSDFDDCKQDLSLALLRAIQSMQAQGERIDRIEAFATTVLQNAVNNALRVAIVREPVTKTSSIDDCGPGGN